MRRSTLSLLAIALILAPLTALAQKIQSKNSLPTNFNSVELAPNRQQINHNAYGVPLNEESSPTAPNMTTDDDSIHLNVEIEPIPEDL